jgi:hypothetical protein
VRLRVACGRTQPAHAVAVAVAGFEIRDALRFRLVEYGGQEA